MLLRGESGTGKELFARAVHDLSARKAKPFVKLNCAALSESVLELELFGHEKGAFTGAVGQRAGRFELAHGGNVAARRNRRDLSELPGKLLRVLQEGEFERVGGTRTMKADFRLICATNKNLEAAVAKGEFRADLYYRINVFRCSCRRCANVPATSPCWPAPSSIKLQRRERPQARIDVGRHGRAEALPFPGNVRELENCVRRAATLAHGEVIGARTFPAPPANACRRSCGPAGGRGAFSDPISELQRAERSSAPTSRAAARRPRPRQARAPARELDEAVATRQACTRAETGDCPAIAPRADEKDRLLDAMERPAGSRPRLRASSASRRARSATRCASTASR